MEKADDCKLDDSRQDGGTENTFLRRKNNDNNDNYRIETYS